MATIAVIGAGIAGLGVARDLRHRGLNVFVSEKSIPGSGASTHNGGVLHSGARYVLENPRLARLCSTENAIISQLAGFAVGRHGGLFLVRPDLQVDEDQFRDGCAEAGIETRRVSREELDTLVSGLNHHVTHAYETPDVVVETGLLIDSYAEELRSLAVPILAGSEVVGAKRNGSGWSLQLTDDDGLTTSRRADIVVNCAGMDSQSVADCFGASFRTSNIEGSMFKCAKRFSPRVITLCGPNIDGNVIVPAIDGCYVGSTWKRGQESQPEILELVKRNAGMMVDHITDLDLANTLTASRTHLEGEENQTRADIDYAVVSHMDEGVANLVSVLPGKFVLHRLVAEKTADLVCTLLGIESISRSASIPVGAPSAITDREARFLL